jgi:hypothetical protein
MRATILSLTLLFFGLFCLVGCGDPPLACTEIGCTDGIYLNFELESGAPVDSFSGEVTLNGDSFEVTCTDGAGVGESYLCLGNTLQLSAGLESTLSLDIGSAADPDLRFVGAVDLDFQEVQPNGPDCPPICDQASVSLPLTPTES